MAQIKWINAAGGDFATGANWMGGTVPGPADDALLTTAGTYTVTSNANATVNSLQMISTVTLSITGGTFYAENGSGSGTDNGLISVGNNTTFEAGGTIAGTGTISLNSTGNPSQFLLNANVTLSGGGKLILGDSNANYVVANAAATLLTNVNDTISGGGNFGNGALSFSNGAAGVVNATAAGNALIVNLGTGTGTNAGLIEATGTAGLIIRSSTITQTGTGALKAIGAGRTLSLDNSKIVGGTLATSGGGVIQSVNSGELSGVTIAAGSTVSALNNTNLVLDGTMTNKGTLTLNSVGNGTGLIVNTATVTLTGAGKVTLSDNTQNYVYSSATTPNLLVNVNNVISGSGQFGNGQLSIDNQALGIINASGANALNISTGAGSFKNEGLLEATNAGALNLNSVSVANTGTILATGSGSAVNLSNTTIVGGTLATTAGGIIESVNAATLDGSTRAVTITANSTVAALNNTSLSLNGSIVNNSTIALNSSGNGTVLLINSPVVTLTGGGKVILSDNSQNYIYSTNATAPFGKLVNTDNTISGAGQFGSAQLSVDNKIGGTINANGVNALTINTAGGTFTNEGLVEDTGAGGLSLNAGTTILNTGTIGAFGAGSHIDLNNGTIQGGTVKTTGGGLIQSVNVGNFDGLTNGALTIAAGSQIADQNNEYLYLEGSIVNQGTIALNSVGNGTFLWVNSPTVTLSGGGTILMTDNGQNFIDATTAGYKLVNVNNTIVGSGQIGRGTQIAFDNQAAGVINANGGSGIQINNGGLASFTNEGLIEDTGTGGIGLNGGTTIVNSGTIAAFGAGSHIDLRNGSSIEGGVLATSGGGVIQSVDQGTLDGATHGAITITAGSQIAVLNNEYLFLDGAIGNQGTFSLDSGGNGTFLWVNSAIVTLTGAGTIAMTDNGQNYIDASVAGNKLVNVNNTIVGSGQIGRGTAVAFDNQAAGIINANGAAGLQINNAGAVSFTNEGLIEDTGTGGIGLNGGTTIVNSGTIGAFGAGSHIDLRNGSSIAGGTISTSGGGVIQSVDQGTLDGASHGAITITAGSQIVDNNNEYLFLDGSVVNHGTITLASGGNGTDLWVNSGTVSLSGGGALTTTDNSQNYVLAAAAGNKLVNVNDVISGAGQVGNGGLLLIDNQAGGVIDATGVNNNLNFNLGGAAFTNEGLAEAAGNAGLLIQNATFTNTGTVASLTGSNVNITASITNLSAGTLTGGTWQAISAGGSATSTLTLAGTPIVTDAAHLVLSGVGATITAGGTSVVSTLTTITAAGELDVLNGAAFGSAGTLSDSGKIVLSGSLSAAAITVLATGSIIANSGTATITTTGKLTDNGTLSATNGGKLVLAGGTLSVAGTVSAAAGSSVTVTATERNANLAANKLSHGTWSVTGSGATITLASAAVTNDAAIITLSGAGSAFKSAAGSKTLESTLTTVSAASQLNVLNNRGFASTVVGGISDSGTISLGGATFGATSLTIAAGGTFLGGGTLTGPVTDNGALISSAAPLGSTGTLTVSGAVSGTGLISVGAATRLNANGRFAVGSVGVSAGATLAGAGSVTGVVTVGGTLALGATGTLTTGSLTVQPGGLVSGASIVASGAILDNSTIDLSPGALSASTITLGTNAKLLGDGTVAQTVASSGTIDAQGGTLALSAGESGGVLIADAGATLSAGAAVAANGLTIAAGGSFIGLGSIGGITTDSGMLTASGGLLTLAGATGTGTAVIANGSTLAVGSALKVSGVSFASGSNEVLQLGVAASNTALISGFASGTTIDIANTLVTSIGYAPAQGVLTLKNGTTVIGNLKLAGSYTAPNFHLSSDGNGGTDITFAGPAVSPLADLHAAIASSAGTPQALGVTAAPVPVAAASLATVPQPTVTGGADPTLAPAHVAGVTMLHSFSVQ